MTKAERSSSNERDMRQYALRLAIKSQENSKQVITVSALLQEAQKIINFLNGEEE